MRQDQCLRARQRQCALLQLLITLKEARAGVRATQRLLLLGSVSRREACRSLLVLRHARICLAQNVDHPLFAESTLYLIQFVSPRGVEPLSQVSAGSRIPGQVTTADRGIFHSHYPNNSTITPFQLCALTCCMRGRWPVFGKAPSVQGCQPQCAPGVRNATSSLLRRTVVLSRLGAAMELPTAAAAALPLAFMFVLYEWREYLAAMAWAWLRQSLRPRPWAFAAK